MLSMPSMPSIPSLPNKPKFLRWPNLSKINGQKLRGLCKLNKLEKLNWPLSNISLADKLPSFRQPGSPVGSTSPVVQPTAPLPPPRTKRTKSRPPSPGSVQPRLATIQPRPHPRPPAPPPSRPSAPAVLEISSPTGVTINGVTVQKPSPMSNTAAGPTPSSTGIIFAARPAVVLSDVPDSSLEISLPYNMCTVPPLLRSTIPGRMPHSSHPPPLPSCPPPDSFQEEYLDENSTDA